MIIEKISGLPFPEYMRKNIFIPAGMKRTYVRRPGQPNTARYIIPAAWYPGYVSVDSLDHMRFDTYYNLGGMWGPGNVISSLQDLYAFDEALKKGKLVSPAILRQAWQVPVLSDGTLFIGPSKHTYGLGWNILYNQYGDTVVFHDGNIPGVNSILYKNLTKDQTILWYTNTMSPGFFQKIYSISNILNGQPVLTIQKTGNKRSVVDAYAKVLVNEGIDQAAITLNALMADTANYFMNELAMNSLGYDLHFKGTFARHDEYALEVMKINILLYKSANAFDSYGDVLMWTGKKKEAIRAYKRSLALNPNNNNAKKNLEILER
jgi:CubicO group peptidase (beta-lactamase class C family)